MKKFYSLLTFVFVVTALWAQIPEKLSYQAVIRDADNNLIKNQEVSMKISILHESIYGASVYVEQQTATTNDNGLVSIEIGSEDATVLFGSIAGIDWSDGIYLMKTETDPEGGDNYSIVGTSQLLSVPYALHAKTAETVKGGVAESDPVFAESEAANITADHISKLGNISGVNTGDQDLSPYAKKTDLETLATISLVQDTAAAIRSAMSNLTGTGEITETDPVFAESEAANITAAHITKLGNLSGINTGDQDLSPYVKKTDVLKLNNTTPFTPDADYEPATKKYVDAKTDSTYKVGDFAMGGIIFWLDESGKHGLICTKEDQAAAVTWDGGTSGKTGAAGNGAYSGEGNTFIIVATSSVFGDDGTGYAAQLCNDLQVTENGITYGDWYLPSANELQLMSEAADKINTTATANGGSAFAAASYWSSTEVTPAAALTVELSSGTSTPQNKATANAVRAIRAF